jgi:hypothetical protein
LFSGPALGRKGECDLGILELGSKGSLQKILLSGFLAKELVILSIYADMN